MKRMNTPVIPGYALGSSVVQDGTTREHVRTFHSLALAIILPTYISWQTNKLL